MNPTAAEILTKRGEVLDHIAFLGLYNADEFRTRIEKWLSRIDTSDVCLIVVDNASQDSTPEWIVDLLQCSTHKNFVVLRNTINLGGYGSLSNTLESLTRTTWVTTLHQDDIYDDAHLRNHRFILSRKLSKLGMVFSEVTSEDHKGRSIAYPRMTWLLDQNPSPAQVFLGHIRNHIYPFSGATFLVEMLKKYPIPWHSTAFPDTELILKSCTEFKAVLADGKPVRYLENPKSESHTLDIHQRDFGAALALVRVFFHPNFESLYLGVPICDRPKFLEHLREGISLRIHDNQLAHFLQHLAVESLSQGIGLTPELARSLRIGFLETGDEFASKLLARLSTIDSSRGDFEADPSFEGENMTATRRRELPGIIFVLKLMAKFVAGMMPLRLRRVLFQQFMRTKLGKKILPEWHVNWSK